jgi:hypothetical protein
MHIGRDDQNLQHNDGIGGKMTISLAQAKSLCTVSELALVSASTRSKIGKLSAAQLRLKVVRARKLRDKWRDQAAKQRREKQAAQRARQTSANARSAEKAQLFGELLGQFEAQLAKLEAKGATGGTSPKRLPRRARSATHRATRAVVRDELRESKLELGGRKKLKKVKPAKTAATASPKATPDEAADAEPTKAKKGAVTMTPPAGKTKQGKRAPTGTGLGPIESARSLQGLRVTKEKQRGAKAAAKQDRLKTAGIIRTQMHASSRTKRRQGKRDAR